MKRLMIVSSILLGVVVWFGFEKPNKSSTAKIKAVDGQMAILTSTSASPWGDAIQIFHCELHGKATVGHAAEMWWIRENGKEHCECRDLGVEYKKESSPNR
jgi:hypothetical protein